MNKNENVYNDRLHKSTRNRVSLKDYFTEEYFLLEAIPVVFLDIFLKFFAANNKNYNLKINLV